MSTNRRSDMNSKKMIMTALAGLLALFGAVRIHAQSGGFRLFGPLSRVVTPNGDGLNDRLFICYDNSRPASGGSTPCSSMSRAHPRGPRAGHPATPRVGRATSRAPCAASMYRIEAEARRTRHFLVVR
jgi:hypothetical protein